MLFVINSGLIICSFRGPLKMGVKSRLVGMGTNLKKFFVTVFDDYKAVGKDTLSDIRARPVKGAVGIGSVILIVQAARTNPDVASFHRLLTQSRVDLSLVSSPIRNKDADGWLQSVTTLDNKNRLRSTNLLLATVLWQSDYPSTCDLFAANCATVKPRWRDYFSRIVDVGVFGRWLLLERRMVDFDINHDEYDVPFQPGMSLQLKA